MNVTFFSKGYFCVVFFFSAAACSQRLAVSVWWCNSVTVFSHWSRKSRAADFWVPVSPLRQETPRKHSRNTLGNRVRLGLTERETSWSQGRGSGNAESYSWKYRTLNSCSGSGPKQIFAMWAGVRRCRERAGGCVLTGQMVKWLVSLLT